MRPAEKIRVLISIRKTSMRRLSDQTGIPISTVRAVINGGRALGSVRADKLAVALGVRSDWLWSDDPWDVLLGERPDSDGGDMADRSRVDARSKGDVTDESYAEFKRFEAFMSIRNRASGVQNR